MPTTPRRPKLKLNIQTVRQLTNPEAAKVVGGVAPAGTDTCGACTCQCYTFTCRAVCDPTELI